MGERGVSDESIGWPYCGVGDRKETATATCSYRPKTASRPGSDDGIADYHFWSYHPNLCQFICVDGAGHVLSYDIDLPTYQRDFQPVRKEKSSSCRPDGEADQPDLPPAA